MKNLFSYIRYKQFSKSNNKYGIRPKKGYNLLTELGNLDKKMVNLSTILYES